MAARPIDADYVIIKLFSNNTNIAIVEYYDVFSHWDLIINKY